MPVLCADIGTSSLKTALVSCRGEVLARCRISFPKVAEGLFLGEHWIQALTEAVASLLGQIPGEEVEGIAISGNGPTLATPAGEVLLWSHLVPTSLADEIQNSLAHCNPPSIFLPRILLFRRLFPRQWAAASTIFSGPEYLIWRLTGTRVTILPEKRFQPAYWSQETLALVNIEMEKLPGFVPPGTRAGHLTQEMACQLGLSPETPVFCGGPDFTVALIGTNTLLAGKICDRAGSSEGINLCLAANPAQAIQKAGIQGIRVLPSVIPGLFNASVLIPDSGTRFSTLKKSVAPQLDYRQFVTALLETPPLSQEGFQLMEELALEVREAYKKLSLVAELTGIPAPSIMTTTGGQAKNPQWLQFKSDIVGTAFCTTACADAELVGDAVLAYLGLGKFASIQEGAAQLVQVHQTFVPNQG